MKKKKIYIVGISILVLMGLLAGLSYGYIMYSGQQETINKVSSDCLKLEIKDITKPITIEKAYPITDEEAEELEDYQFSVQNVCKLSVDYQVNLEIMQSDKKLNDEYVAIKFNGGDKKLVSNLPNTTPTYTGSDYEVAEAKGLTSGVLAGGEKVEYKIKLWMNEDVTVEDDAMNKEFISKIGVTADFSQIASIYTEDILHGADPVLEDDLIPVRIAKDGTVTKANIETEWYSYEKKNWANAVILTEEGKKKTYNNYDVIPEDAIESYFVWIPKYSYEIFDLGEYTKLESVQENKEQPIKIKFGTENTEDNNDSEYNQCTTPMNDDQGISGGKGNCQVGDYMTHPAFISMGTNGLWVGKFESGYKGADSAETAKVNENDHTKLQIKPDVYSWRNIQVANAYQTSYNYNRELDSHMMKNTEWGAVAYLTNSIYGTCTGDVCEEIRINNANDYKTGYAGINKPTIGLTNTNESCSSHPEACNEYGDSTSELNEAWNTSTGVLASTTQNITGIYDMSGGSIEYLMSVVFWEDNEPIIGSTQTGNSGFSGKSNDNNSVEGIAFPINDTKYYDKYEYNTLASNFKLRILGDATGEIGPFGQAKYKESTRNISSWYSDVSVFAYNNWPWFRRGGAYNEGLDTGIFNFHEHNGNAQPTISFRVVLATNN